MKRKRHFREGTKSPKKEQGIRKPIRRLWWRKFSGGYSQGAHPSSGQGAPSASGMFVSQHFRILMIPWLVSLGRLWWEVMFIWHDTAWHGVVSLYGMDVGSVCVLGAYILSSLVSGYRRLILEEILRHLTPFRCQIWSPNHVRLLRDLRWRTYVASEKSVSYYSQKAQIHCRNICAAL